MSQLKPGGFRMGVDREYSKEFPLADGDCVASGGIAVSPVATFGTTATEILAKTIDPGFAVKLQSLVGTFHHRFTGLDAADVGSLLCYWTVQPKNYGVMSGGFLVKVTGTTINVTGTLNNNVGTLAVTDFLYHGELPIGSIPFAPIEVKLTAVGLKAAIATGRVRADSSIKLVGHILPGT